MYGIARTVEVALGVGSIAMFVGTLVAIPVILARVPDDWFVRPRSVRSLPLRVARAVVGVTVVALGIAMLVLPGQGLLTILVGLGILDIPFKHRLVTRLLSNPKVHGAIDRMRHKAGRGSLELPVSSLTSVPA